MTLSLSVAQIINGLNNKYLESHIAVNAEKSDRVRCKLQLLLILPTPQPEKGFQCVLYSSLCTAISIPVSSFLVLELKACGSVFSEWEEHII